MQAYQQVETEIPNFQLALKKQDFSKEVLVRVYNRRHSACLTPQGLTVSQIILLLIDYIVDAGPYRSEIHDAFAHDPELQFTRRKSPASQSKKAIFETIEYTLFKTMAEHLPARQWAQYVLLPNEEKCMQAFCDTVKRGKPGLEAVLDIMKQKALNGKYDGAPLNSDVYRELQELLKPQKAPESEGHACPKIPKNGQDEDERNTNSLGKNHREEKRLKPTIRSISTQTNIVDVS